MIKLTTDLHGFTVEDAMKEVEKILYCQWSQTGNVQLTVITGKGKIKQALIKYLDKNKIDYYVPMHNAGMIVITIS